MNISLFFLKKILMGFFFFFFFSTKNVSNRSSLSLIKGDCGQGGSSMFSFDVMMHAPVYCPMHPTVASHANHRPSIVLTPTPFFLLYSKFGIYGEIGVS